MSTIADAALEYHARGWKPVPVSRKGKKAIGKGWQKRKFDARAFNGNAQNVGIQLGAESGGLTDVDLDTRAAIGFAPEFLPPTAAIFGRRSKPASHQLYLTDLYKTEKKAVTQYKDITGAVIVELRTGGNNKGAASVLPPSMNEIGEMVEWVRDGEPARVDGALLKRAVLQLAVACLLMLHYPGQGSRHEGALVLGGVLARALWSAEEIGHLVEVVARAAGDDEIEDRVTAATSALQAKANGHDVAGLPRLGELWGDDAALTLGKWLPRARHTNNVGEEQAPDFSDEWLALQFAQRHADNLRFVAFRSHWFFWDGCRWAIDKTLRAFDHARAICRQQASQNEKAHTATALASAKTVAAVERLAKADRRLAATTEQWDADPENFNTPHNGEADQ